MPVVKIFRTIERSDNWSVIFFQSVLFYELRFYTIAKFIYFSAAKI